MSQPEPVRVRKRLGGGYVIDFPLLGGTAYEAVCYTLGQLSEWLRRHFEEVTVGAADGTRIGVDGVEVLTHQGRANWGGGMKTIPNESGVTSVTFEPSFSAICSIGKAPFGGTIKIEYKPGTKLLEFISVEAWIATLTAQEVTIEEVTRLTFDAVLRVLGDIPLRVTVFARTTVHAPVSAKIAKGDWDEKEYDMDDRRFGWGIPSMPSRC